MKGKIFNAQEVQAIIAGNKTQFREVIKKTQIEPSGFLDRCGMELLLSECPYQVGQKIFVKESFLQKLGSTQLPSGEHETFFTGSNVEYVADGAQERWDNPDVFYPNWWKKRPAQHMKQEQSRITLQITSIRVERLGGDICEENLPQGFRQIKDRNHFMYDTHIKRIPCNCGNSSPTLLSSVNIRTFLKESAYKFMCPECKKTPNETYITSNGASCYWNDLIDPSWREKSESTHKKPEEKFDANPFVWIVDFKINK